MTKRALWLSLVLALTAVVLSVVAAAPATSATRSESMSSTKHAGVAVQSGVLPLGARSEPVASSAVAGATAEALCARRRIRRSATRRSDARPGRRHPGGTGSASFTLRAIGEHVEIWVQSHARTHRALGHNFPAGDCRNNGVRTSITDAQVDYLVNEFDTNMYPKESAAFSVPPTATARTRRCPA